MKWSIETKKGSNSGVNPYLLVDGMEVDLPLKYCKLFGFTVTGPELGIISSDEPTGSIEQQEKAIIQILKDALLNEKQDPKIWFLNNWLSSYKGKMILGKIKPMSKKEIEAIKIVKNIINCEAQEINQKLKEIKR